MSDPHESHWFRHDAASGLWLCEWCGCAMGDGLALSWCMPLAGNCHLRKRWHAWLDAERGGIRPARGANAPHTRARVVTDRMARNAVHAMYNDAQRLPEVARGFGVDRDELRRKIAALGLELPGIEYRLDEDSVRRKYGRTKGAA